MQAATRNTSERALTDFEQILLGLICLADASGYDLKQRLVATPLGVYQPSSGALYPALRRLQQRGLIRARRPVSHEGTSRRRHVLQASAAGRAEHIAWIREPVEPRTISADLRLHVMRFVMMESLLTPDEVLSFLHGLEDALTAFIAELDHYVATTNGSNHARLALEHGRAVHCASLAWVTRTITKLNNAAALASS